MGQHHSNVAVLVVGVLFVIYGVVSILAAITDYRHWMTTMYEDNKDRKVGFVAISSSAAKYRRNIGLSGAVFLIFGILALANG